TNLVILRGARRMIVARGAYAPFAWSPDARRLEFATGTALVSVNADGTGRRILIAGLVGEQGEAIEPAWSPDGEHVAYRDGSYGTLAILDLATAKTAPVAACDPGSLSTPVSDVTWSPDGRQIGFAAGPTLICTSNLGGLQSVARVEHEPPNGFALAWT